MSHLRTTARSARTLLSLATTPDPRRSLLGYAPFYPLAAAGSYVAARHLLRALPAADRGAVVLAATLFAASFLCAAVLGRMGNTTRVRLVELTKLELDHRIVAAAIAIPEVGHMERPEYLDRMELLRTRAQDVAHAPRMIGWLIDAGGSLLVSVTLLFAVRPALVLLVLVGLPTMVVNRRAQRRIDAVHAAQAPTSRRAFHYFDLATTPAPAKEVRVCRLGDELLGRYRDEWLASDRALARAEVRAAVEKGIATMLALAAFAVTLSVLANAVREGDLGPAEMFIVLGLIALLVGQIGGAAEGVSSFGRGVGVVENLVLLEDAARAAASDRARRSASVPEVLSSGIRLDGVSFRYAGTDVDAVTDIDLFLPAGSVVAFVGDNGAGKSTLVKLLFGLYSPTTGRVTVDGVDLAEIPLDDWRARTSASFQDFLRLELTLQQSVGAGDLPHLDDSVAVKDALARGGGLDLLDRVPGGLQAQIGTRLGGSDLSGGQWQLLAISRAHMRREPLLLALDEPTSALDPLAEHALFERQASTARDLGGRAGTVTVLVSHRFSTVRMADLIVVVSNARIEEVGTHASLTAKGGTYARLYEMQAQHYR